VVLDDTSILQTDAAVIAGLLVLLTIYSLNYPISPQKKRIHNVLRPAIMAVIIPFAYSAILTILGQLGPAKLLAIIGFFFVVISIYLILNAPLIGIRKVTGANTQSTKQDED
jgi:hypothetical protein